MIENRVAAAKFDRIDISRFAESITPNVDSQQLVADQMLSEIPGVIFWRTPCF